MAELNLLEAINQALDQAMANDERVYIIGEDVGQRGGVFRVTDGLHAKYGSKRVIDAPLAESIIIGSSIGAAMYGMRPIAEIQFADFIFPAFNQIISEAARMRYRSNNTWEVPLVIRAPYGGGIHGALYHSQSIEAFFAHIPGLKVVAPSTPYDAKAMLLAAIDDPDPVLFLEHKKCYRLIKGYVPDEHYTVPIGKADIAREGSDVSVITYGMMRHYAVEAAEMLAKEDMSVEVVDLRSLVPLDRETILNSVKKTSKVLVLYEDNLFGGYGAEIAAIIAQDGFEHLDAPVQRLAGLDIPAMPYSAPLENEFLPTPSKIADTLRDLVNY